MGVPLLRLRETLRIERHYDNKSTAALLGLQQQQQSTRASLRVQLLVVQAVLMLVLLLQMYMCLLSGRD